jgi:hypothetical protein
MFVSRATTLRVNKRREMFSHSLQLRALLPILALALLVFAPAAKSAARDGLFGSAATAQPNLAPLNINLSAYSARPGDQVAFSLTMTNSGAVSCPPSFTGIYLTQFPNTRPSGEPSLMLNTPDIAAHSSLRQTNSIAVPFNAPLGTYYLWVVADALPSSVNQSTRLDDAARSSALAVVTVTRQPNLVPQNVMLSASAARPGDQIVVMWTLANAGNVTCPASLTGFHLGASSSAPPASDLLNLRFETPEINANSAIRFTNLITIPTNAALGTYYFWVVAADVPASTINQSSRADDAARSAALSIVSVVTRPNLVPLDVALSSSQVRPGTQLTVMWSVRNSGNANCPASTTGLHLGSSATNRPASDPLNLKISTPAINTNSFVRQTNTVTIPATTALGNYYLWILVDDVPNSSVNQSSRTDDAARSSLLAVVSVIRQPNLAATNVILSTPFVRPGDQVTAIWTILNNGNTNAAASQTGLRLGTSATVRPTNSLLNISIATPEIRTNLSLRQTNVFTIPTNAPLGTNYLWVIADDVPNSTLNQSSRADDAAVSGPLAIVTVLPQPNLAPLNITLSSYSARPGDQLTVTWMMTNSGNATCPASITGVHLGQSPTIRPTNDALNVSVQTPAINAKAFVRQTNVLTIPATTTSGTYYVWVVADDVPNSTLNQISRADDAARSAALAIAAVPSVSLIAPAPSATVDAPPAFEWNAPAAANAEIYLAAKPSPVLGTDKVVFFDNPAGTNKFKPAPTNWAAAVAALGYAQNYYWTAGSSDPARRETYADWRPFKAIPIPVSATVRSTPTGQFQFQIAAPNHSQVVIEASESLTNNWATIATLPNASGTITYTEPTAASKPRRFFRARP